MSSDGALTILNGRQKLLTVSFTCMERSPRSQRRATAQKNFVKSTSAFSTKTARESGCRSDLHSPHGLKGAVRGKPVALPAQTPEQG